MHSNLIPYWFVIKAEINFVFYQHREAKIGVYSVRRMVDTFVLKVRGLRPGRDGSIKSGEAGNEH